MSAVDPTLELPPDVSLNGSSADNEFSCDQDGCSYVASGANPKVSLGLHKWSKHGIAGRGHKRSKRRLREGRKPREHKSSVKDSSSAPAAKAGARPAPRRSIANFASAGWAFAGTNFVPGKAGGFVAWEAPAAGPIIDRLAAGTWVDRRLLQPIASGADKWEDVGALVVLPVIAFAVGKNPAIREAPMVRDMARDALIRVLSVELDHEIKEKERMEALERKAVRAGYAGGVEEKVGQMMAILFDEVPAPEGAPVAA